MGFQTWRWGSRHGDGVPDMGMGFQTQKNLNFLYRWRGPLVMIFDRVGLGKGHGDGVPDRGWGTRHRWGSRHGMMGYQTEMGC